MIGNDRKIITLFTVLQLRSKKAGRFEKLLGFTGGHSNVIRGSVSRS